MKQEITTKEQFSSAWKIIAIGSFILALVFFIIFLISNDPLWKGIFRFIAFIAFVGLVFSILRLREGQNKVAIELHDEQLLITYFQKSESVKEELFERKTIKEICKNEYNPFNLSFIKGYEYIITFTDTKNELPLFEYGGRNFHFSKEEAKKIDHFIKNITTDEAHL